MRQKTNSRRDFLKKSGILALGGLGATTLSSGIFNSAHAELFQEPPPGTFVLPQLPYAYNDLEPHIDALTMEIHHSRHHQGYINSLNQAVRETKIRVSLDTMLQQVSKYPVSIRNNAGGHWNHSFFWKLLTPEGGGAPRGMAAEAINAGFGDFLEFKRAFITEAAKRFGSGWAWLVVNSQGKLEIGSTPNQDNPMMDISEFKGVPVLGIDVWEHAYYLKYQNKRGEYISAWWNLINWDQVAENLKLATTK